MQKLSCVVISIFIIVGLIVAQPAMVLQAGTPTQSSTEEPTVTPTILVNSTADYAEGCPEKCTLRSAIATAQDDDIIGFDSSIKGTITLREPLVIEHNITIAGPGADVLAIDGDKKVRVFKIDYSTVTISGLTIQHGLTSDSSDNGAGIDNLGSLTLSEVVVTENESAGGGGGIGSYRELMITDSTISDNVAKEYGGGGIDSNGTLTLANSTITGNSVAQNGGGILITSGNGGETTITNTTIVANKSEFSGAGISNGSTDSGGNVVIVNSTIAQNEAGFEGGGVYNSSGTLTIGSSIVWGNTDSFKHPDISGEIKSKGYNLIGDPGDVKGLLKTDQKKVDPSLNSLAVNEPGQTQTMALGEGSPAIGKGGKTCPETDQRGVTRKKPCDVGAYETEK